MGKGEIARNEQFLLFPQCFKRLVLQTREHRGLLGKGLKGYFIPQKSNFQMISFEVLLTASKFHFLTWLTLSQTTNFRLWKRRNS